MPETEFQSLDQEDPLEDETSTYSTTHDYRIPWTEEPGGLPSVWSHRLGHDLAATTAANKNKNNNNKKKNYSP